MRSRATRPLSGRPCCPRRQGHCTQGPPPPRMPVSRAEGGRLRPGRGALGSRSCSEPPGQAAAGGPASQLSPLAATPASLPPPDADPTAAAATGHLSALRALSEEAPRSSREGTLHSARVGTVRTDVCYPRAWGGTATPLAGKTQRQLWRHSPLKSV